MAKKEVVSFPRVTDSGAFTRPADLFEGLDDLEGAAFGRTKIRRQIVGVHLFQKFGIVLHTSRNMISGAVRQYTDGKVQDATGSDEETGADEDEEDDDDDDDDDDEAFGEYGISDEELMDPSDDFRLGLIFWLLLAAIRSRTALVEIRLVQSAHLVIR
jgi:hypothetical protein